MKNPFSILLIFVVIIAGIVMIRPVVKKMVTPATTRPTPHPQYDKALFGIDQDTKHSIDELKSQLKQPDEYLFQQFASGKTAAIYMPKNVDASPSAYTQGSVAGLQVSTTDFYLTLFHILKLDNPTTFCTNLAIKNYHVTAFTKDQRRLSAKKASTMSWELAGKNHESIQQINACYKDGSDTVWIMDLYFPKKIYDEKYHQHVNQLVDSFVYR